MFLECFVPAKCTRSSVGDAQRKAERFYASRRSVLGTAVWLLGLSAAGCASAVEVPPEYPALEAPPPESHASDAAHAPVEPAPEPGATAISPAPAP
jgi:hypothetical protein